jgi:Mg/Co/Ni transporter MgtE
MKAAQQVKTKANIITELAKTPIVEVVCKRAGISRATFYRWRKDDKQFAETTDEALVDGTKIINDMAESQLISAIREKNLTAIIFWLKNHHATYKTKVEVTNKTEEDRELSPEQADEVQRAITLATININEEQHGIDTKEISE